MLSKWNDEIIITKLIEITNNIGHFPTEKEIYNLKYIGLMGGIGRNGGLPKFRKLLGYYNKSYWPEEKIIEEIKIVINDIGHFPTYKELQNLGKYKLISYLNYRGGFYKYREIFKEKPLRVQKNYWNDETIVNELKAIIDKIGYFPESKELKNINSKLYHAINNTKGCNINKFKKILGYEITKHSNDYWNDDIILKKLKEIINEIGHFPTSDEIKNYSILTPINKFGGINKFRTLLGYEIIKKDNKYWTENKIIEKLKEIINEIGHFPKQIELQKNNHSDLSSAISCNGGLNKFRTLLGYELLAKRNYWNDETIIKELNEIINKIKYFPTQQELYLLSPDLKTAINRNGGLVKFRTLLGYELLEKPKNYWNKENTIKELKIVINKIGHFPTQTEIRNLNLSSLDMAICKNGNYDKFRDLLGYKKEEYWNDEKIISELKIIINNLGYFPTVHEIEQIRTPQYGIVSYDLTSAIYKYGGINKFRTLLGYTPSEYEQYCTEQRSYSTKRGKNTENLVKQILQDWCMENGYNEPTYNKKLSKGNVIEFICNIDKKIGIDVTNTKSGYKRCISNKYKHKDYYKYLDELWIIVFNNMLTNNDYIKFNEDASRFLKKQNESPNKIRIMSIDQFLQELRYSANTHTKNKIDAYKQCTFRTREEFINELNGDKSESKQITFQ